MATSSSLILLINSLTKGEKRYLQLYASMQDGAKDYMYLFDLVEKSTDMKLVKRNFSKGKPAASYEVTSKYLFKVITDCLIHVRANQDKTTRLTMSLLKAKILFEKSMPEEGFRQLQKIRESAEKYEEYMVLTWASRMEMHYLAIFNFNNITEKELIHKQMKIDELLKYAKNIHRHTSLYELLRFRLIFKGGARTKTQKEELNDLIVTELSLISNPLAETFETQKIHLLFQAHYFITINDYRSALKAFYELNDLLEENEYLWNDSPMDYLSTIEGMLESLRMIRQYDEMNVFLDKLQNLRNRSVYMEVMVQRVNFTYRLIQLLDQGEFDKAIVLKDEFNDVLFKKIHLLDLSKQAELYLYTSLIYISVGNLNRAHYFLNKVLMESKMFYSLPIYRTFRLLHLLVHYELGNHDYIAYETRSIKRALNASRTKTYLLENLMLKFMKQASIPSGQAARSEIWKKIKKQFEIIRNDKYEIQLFKIFDFESWVEAKLSNKSYNVFVKDKLKRQQSATAGSI